MGLQRFERRLEKMVEGTFARVFRSDLRPIELGRRLVRDMEAGRSVDVRGRVIVPNDYCVWLSEDDHTQFAPIHDSLCRELADAARDAARERGFGFVGPVQVELGIDPRRKSGSFEIEATLREGEGGVGPGSVVFPDQTRIPVGQGLTVGRLTSCDITIADPNVSRHHAEIRPQGDGYVLVDLGSTNGCKVNGSRVAEQRLVDGDEVTFGPVTVVFEAS